MCLRLVSEFTHTYKILEDSSSPSYRRDLIQSPLNCPALQNYLRESRELPFQEFRVGIDECQ